jgi:hypothetical protein
MNPLFFAKQRLAAFQDEVDRLAHAEFPYPAAEASIQRIKEACVEQVDTLGLLDEDSDPTTINIYCKEQLAFLWDCLPLLGLILRSTNVRNAFEIYTPLQRLAWRILGPNAQLVLSSEWDYSPFTYTQVPLLPGFVFIGLPAHESGNPLIVPMAGHELGHSIWREVVKKSLWHPAFIRQLKAAILNKIRAQWPEFHKLHPEIAKPEDLDTTLFATATWSPALTWAERQSEEYFCDFIGLRLFGESFLYAFAHLLCPVLEGRRALHYPNVLRRVRFQIRAAQQYGIPTPDNYETWFEDREEPSADDMHGKFLVGLADFAADELTPELIIHATSSLDQPGLPNWKDADQTKNYAAIVQRIYNNFEIVAPAEHTEYIAHVINAGWRAAENGVPVLVNHSSEAVLCELVLKSLEVLEFETKTQITP